jgi:hypothetical protein
MKPAIPYLNCSSEPVASERKEKQEFSDSDVVEDVEGFNHLRFNVRLGGGGGLVLVHEHGDSDDDEKNEKVLQHWVTLPAENNTEDHHRNRLARFTDNLEIILSIHKYRVVQQFS